MEAFKSWSGEIRFLSNFKLRKYKRKDLEDNLIGEEESSSTAQTEDDAMDDDKEEDTEGVEEGEDNDEDDDDDMEGWL